MFAIKSLVGLFSFWSLSPIGDVQGFWLVCFFPGGCLQGFFGVGSSLNSGFFTSISSVWQFYRRYKTWWESIKVVGRNCYKDKIMKVTRRLLILQISAFFLFSNIRKGRLLYIHPVGWLVGRSVGWSVDVTINFFQYIQA